MKKLSEYTEISIRRDTHNLLYWMGKAAYYLKQGNAHMAHLALSNALSRCVTLIETQTRIEDMEKPNWEQIYSACLDSAQEELKEELKEDKETYGD